MSNQMSEKRLPMIRKLGYGIGDTGSNFCWSYVASFFMLYCTNILGVNAAVVGTLLLFSRVLDGITDVFMGRIIDATHSKMGKARFWYFVSSFPVALFTFLLFNIPGSFTEQTKYIYIFITYTLMSAVFYTMNNIAYSSLVALVTKSSKDRVQMGSFRVLFAIVGSLLISYLTSGLVDSFGGGQQGWRVVSVIYSIVCLALLLIPVIAVKELSEEELNDGIQTSDNTASKSTFFEGFMLVFKNKFFVMIMLIYLINYLSGGITGGMGIYFAMYQLGDAALLGPISLAGMFPLAVVLPFVPQMTAKLGIQKTGIIGYVIGVVGSIIIIVGGQSGNFTVVMVGMVMKAAGAAPLGGALTALIAEVDDYSHLKFGKRATGTLYSCSSVGIKVGTGLGTAACGFLLELGGFDGMAATQTATAIATINWTYLLASSIPQLLVLIILVFLTVENDNKKLRAATVN